RRADRTAQERLRDRAHAREQLRRSQRRSHAAHRLGAQPAPQEPLRWAGAPVHGPAAAAWARRTERRDATRLRAEPPMTRLHGTGETSKTREQFGELERSI